MASNLFLLLFACILKKDIEDARKQILSIEQEIAEGKYKPREYSQEVQNIIEFYINNREWLIL